MVPQIAAPLRQLLQEDTSRKPCSLLITGHSAGGAVASLIFAHTLSQTIESELTLLANCFRRIDCVTFGVPPISLLPLRRPDPGLHKRSLFVSFVNEGDPVVRIGRDYITSLLRLITLERPSVASQSGPLCRFRKRPVKAQLGNWIVPQTGLSNAGKLVLLRERPQNPQEHQVEACCITDQDLRAVIYGDLHST